MKRSRESESKSSNRKQCQQNKGKHDCLILSGILKYKEDLNILIGLNKFYRNSSRDLNIPGSQFLNLTKQWLNPGEERPKED
ncbi:unnamed protein product [Acanthoscelides obtectus]|uniref:Uncharacterized protein n=1 Tax=Acanthoscelides obtectus TaxID=200917 RepID=A0A9P0P4K3_ACAOB|nr:unnamed protein product [Acanthoscelides obtectus]CAK1671989.1 hypothetical protein AOBTE_LOCUS28595 [Acanthoscelides obtectus]